MRGAILTLTEHCLIQCRFGGTFVVDFFKEHGVELP